MENQDPSILKDPIKWKVNAVLPIVNPQVKHKQNLLNSSIFEKESCLQESFSFFNYTFESAAAQSGLPIGKVININR